MITVCGANTTLDELRAIPLERPAKAGRAWQGIQHGELVDAVIDEASSRGWTVGDMRFSVSKDRTGMAGAVDLVVPEIQMPTGVGLALGFLTANDRSRSVRLIVGGNVFCCLNGMARGDIVLSRRHTRAFDLYESIQGAMDEYVFAAAAMPGEVLALQNMEAPPDRTEHVLMEAGRQGIMPWTHLGEVDAQIRNPSFAEWGKGTAWTVYNAFTYVVKKSPALAQMNRIGKFRGLVLDSLGTAA